MTIGDEIVAYPNFNHSINATKLLDIKDGDLEFLYKQYKVNRKAVEEMIANIHDWYDKQPHLPKGQLHDRMILGHLITRGFSVEQTKEKIDNYFSASTRMPDLIGGRWPFSANFEKYLKDGYWTISPKRTKENHRIIVFRIMHPEMVVHDIVKLGFMMSEYRMFNETTQGDHWVLDFSNATLSHALQFNPMLISQTYYNVTSCWSIKLKGIHLVNVPAFGHSILALFKKIMKPKHASRLHLYEGFEKVFKVLPRDKFPKDLGGTLDMTVQDISDLWHDTFLSKDWQHYFEHQSTKFVTDESKRITASKIGDAFGVEGSFRKLELD